MKVLCIIGWSGSGKTSLLVGLLPQLARRGVRHAVLKHSSHPHPLHRPGSDSERLQNSGAALVGFATPEGVSLTWTAEPATDVVALFERVDPSLELLLVEGWKEGPHARILVESAPPFGPSVAAGEVEGSAAQSGLDSGSLRAPTLDLNGVPRTHPRPVPGAIIAVIGDGSTGEGPRRFHPGALSELADFLTHWTRAS